jgi:hypothetical protein
MYLQMMDPVILLKEMKKKDMYWKGLLRLHFLGKRHFLGKSVAKTHTHTHTHFLGKSVAKKTHTLFSPFSSLVKSVFLLHFF